MVHLETFSLADPNLETAGEGSGVGSAPEPQGGPWLVLWAECACQLALFHSCLPGLQKWKATGLRAQERVGAGSHTRFETDVQQLTPLPESLGRKETQLGQIRSGCRGGLERAA